MGTTTRRNASAMRMVGALLALYRRNAGHTQRSLGERFVVGEQQIASVEQGRRPLKPGLAAQLDELLDTRGALSTALSRMPEVDLVPSWAEEFLDREREAIAISSYENQVLPGLLQTEAYAWAVFRSRVPFHDEDTIARLAAARIERQVILHARTRPSPASWSGSRWCGRRSAGGTCGPSSSATCGRAPSCRV
jgi:transcriptional regulator with XRE-family HTH domain